MLDLGFLVFVRSLEEQLKIVKKSLTTVNTKCYYLPHQDLTSPELLKSHPPPKKI